MNDIKLLEQFVPLFTFEPWDDDECCEVIAQDTPAAALDCIYNKIRIRYPRLYEKLVLKYRWTHRAIVLSQQGESLQFLANPPGPKLDGLHAEIFNDTVCQVIV